MSNKYEIKYKHYDMPSEHMGKTTKWANDKKKALSFLCRSQPNKDGVCLTKKGAIIQIIEVNEIPPSD